MNYKNIKKQTNNGQGDDITFEEILPSFGQTLQEIIWIFKRTVYEIYT